MINGMTNKEFIEDLRERAKAEFLPLDEEYWLKLSKDMKLFLNSDPTPEERKLFWTTVRWDAVTMIVDWIKQERRKKEENKESE